MYSVSPAAAGDLVLTNTHHQEMQPIYEEIPSYDIIKERPSYEIIKEPPSHDIIALSNPSYISAMPGQGQGSASGGDEEYKYEEMKPVPPRALYENTMY